MNKLMFLFFIIPNNLRLLPAFGLQRPSFCGALGLFLSRPQLVAELRQKVRAVAPKPRSH